MIKKNTLRFLAVLISASMGLNEAAPAQVLATDSLALEALYDSTGGANWNNNANWLTEQPVSTWSGITVSDGRVSGIHLNGNNLVGTLPADIGDLTDLTDLILFNNQLSGPIPIEIANLTHLITLDLADNQLSGTIPPALSDLPELQTLFLSSNQLSGAIPPEIGNLPQLRTLFLSSNQLSGVIPTEMGNLASLVLLNMRSNQLSGTIPAELGNLIDLESFSLDDNQLSGAIPPELGNLINLSDLNLSRNQLTGDIPAEIGNLASLTFLHLGSNQFTGAIPPAIGNLVSLGFLDLGFNLLTGTIPAELSNLTHLTDLFLGGNQLFGAVPAGFANLGSLARLDLSRNNLADLPELSSLFELRITHNQFTFEDIEPNVGIPKFFYSPQANVGTEQDTTVTSGSSLTLCVTVGGTNNQYQWFEDGFALSGATNSCYTIASVDTSHSGSYTCEITNTVATDLTLNSRPIHVSLGDTTGPLSRSDAAAIVIDLIPNLLLNTSDIWVMMPQELLAAGDTLQSLDQSEFDSVLTSDQWFAWVDFNRLADFSHPGFFLLIDPINGFTRQDSVNWFPLINGTYPATFDDITYPDLIFGDTLMPQVAAVPDVISDSTGQTTSSDSVCAVLVSGAVLRPVDSHFNDDLHKMEANLKYERLGPRLANVVQLRGASNQEINAQLASMQGKYKKVYFYYRGHGGVSTMVTPDSARMNYHELFLKLSAIGAEDVTVFISACYSGSAIEVFRTFSGDYDFSNMTIMTSARGDSLSYRFPIQTATGQWIFPGAFDLHFFSCFGDPGAEIDGLAGISETEAFAWVRKLNPEITFSSGPKHMNVLMDPQMFTNSPPIANNDIAHTAKNQEVKINVISNDADPDSGDAVQPNSISIVQQPSHGVLLAQDDGTVVYVPQLGFHGMDVFSYTVRDKHNAKSNTASVSITVSAPVSRDDAVATVVELMPALVPDTNDVWAFMPQTALDSGDVVQSFAPFEFDSTLGAGTWFAWVDFGRDLRFEQPGMFIFVDTLTSAIDTARVNWWPLINGTPYLVDLDLRNTTIDLFFGARRQPVLIDSAATISEPAAVSSTAGDTCAVLVSGQAYSPGQRSTFDADVDLVMRNLSRERFGPRLRQENIRIMNDPTWNEVLDTLSAMNGKYQKIYFYFSGHGAKPGPSIRKEGISTYYELFLRLQQTAASDITVILDACRSGAAIARLDSLSNKFEISGQSLTLMVSSKANTSSWTRTMVTTAGDTVRIGEYTWAWAQCFGDPRADLDGNGETSDAEVHAWIRSQNAVLNVGGTMNQRMNPQLFSVEPMPGLTRTAAISHLTGHIRQRLEDTLSVTGYMTQDFLRPGDLLSCFDNAFSVTIEVPTYLGWIDQGNGAYFQHESEVAWFDGTGSMLVQPILSWPLVNGVFPFDIDAPFPDSLALFFGNRPPSIDSDAPTPVLDFAANPTAGDSVCGIVVSGVKGRRTDKYFACDLDFMEQELKYERLGPRLSNVIRIDHATKAQIKQQLTSMRGKYKKIYFFYAGHGARNRLETDSLIVNRLSHVELLQALSDVQAEDVTLLLNACYSGSVIDAFKENKDQFSFNKLTIIASSRGDRASWFYTIRDPDQDRLYAPGVFSWFFTNCWGVPAADKDGMQGINVREAFEWMRETDPLIERVVDGETVHLSMNDGMDPQFFTYEAKTPTSTGFSFPGLDLSVTSYDPFADNIIFDAALQYRLIDTTSDDAKVESISPSRFWYVEVRPEGSALNLDLKFHYRPDFDVITPDQDRIGLVRRENPGEPWQLYTPTETDTAGRTVTAKGVTGFSGWALATLRLGTNVAFSQTATAPRVYALQQSHPNPFNLQTEVQYQLPVASRVSITIYNILGQKVRALLDDDVAAGWHKVYWDGRNSGGGQVVGGLYICVMEAVGADKRRFKVSMKMLLIR